MAETKHIIKSTEEQYQDTATLNALKSSHPEFSRTPQEVSKLQRVISTLFGLSSGRFGFKLLPHPINWACGFSSDTQGRIEEELQNGSLDLQNMSDDQFSPDAFYYPLEELKTLPEQEIYGVTHHESAHAQYTSFRLLLLGHKLAEQDGKMPTTWGLVLNGVEDGRINRMKSAESDVTKEQIAALYERWEKDVVANISTQSLVRQYTLNAVHCWLKNGPIPSGLDPRVQSVFEETKDSVFRYIHEDGREESFQILRDEIWPKVKVLEDEAKKDQELRDLKNNKKNLWDKLKDKMQGKNEGGGDSQPLSPEEREQLQKEFDKLPDEKKNELRQKAQEEVDKRQAEDANKDGVKGFSYDFDNKSKKFKLKQKPMPGDEEKKLGEKIIDDALDAESDKQAEELKRQKKQTEMLRNGFKEDEESQFDDFITVRNSIVGLKNNFMRNLQGILPREILKDFGGEYHSGPRINIGKLVKRAPVRDARFYERRSEERVGDPLLNVELIVDNSASMDGIKMHEARRATLLTLEVLSDLGLPSCVKRFASSFDWIQNRKQDYAAGKSRIKPRVISSLNADGGGTNISEPLEESKDSITAFKLRHPKTLCLVVVITDGGANSGKTGGELKQLVEDTQRQAIVVNINLSGSASEIKKSKDYFGERNVVVCDSASELPDALIRVLKGAFERAVNKMK